MRSSVNAMSDPCSFERPCPAFGTAVRRRRRRARVQTYAFFAVGVELGLRSNITASFRYRIRIFMWRRRVARATPIRFSFHGIRRAKYALDDDVLPRKGRCHRYRNAYGCCYLSYVCFHCFSKSSLQSPLFRGYGWVSPVKRFPLKSRTFCSRSTRCTSTSSPTVTYSVSIRTRKWISASATFNATLSKPYAWISRSSEFSVSATSSAENAFVAKLSPRIGVTFDADFSNGTRAFSSFIAFPRDQLAKARAAARTSFIAFAVGTCRPENDSSSSNSSRTTASHSSESARRRKRVVAATLSKSSFAMCSM